MTVNVTMRQMLEAGVHFGHQTRYWNPKMTPFIYGVRHNIHIINLETSLPMFRDAISFVRGVVEKRGKVLFVGTKHAARDVVREEATRCGMPYVDYRWLGGMLTNYKTIRQSIKRLRELEELLSNEDNLEGMTKKEVLNLVRAKDKLHVNLSGIKNMGGLPDVIFIIDVGQEKIAIQEARRLGIPVVGVVDTNSTPEGIDYAIPGNDDAVRSIRLYCKTIADTILDVRGEMELADAAKKEKDAANQDKKKVVTRKTKAKAAKADGADEQPAAAQQAEVTPIKEAVAADKTATEAASATEVKVNAGDK